jgi:hypothetical protein
MISIGVDPGLKGAVVAIDSSFKVIYWRDAPTIPITKKKKGGKESHLNEFAPCAMAEIIGEILRYANKVSETFLKAWLEEAQAMPEQGLRSTFQTGKGAGLWEGILAGLCVPYDLIRPHIWTKFMLAGTPVGDPKQRSMIKAQRLFGASLPLIKPNGRVLSMDGRADAALIASYGMHQMLQTIQKIVTRTPVPRRK